MRLWRPPPCPRISRRRSTARTVASHRLTSAPSTVLAAVCAWCGADRRPCPRTSTSAFPALAASMSCTGSTSRDLPPVRSVAVRCARRYPQRLWSSRARVGPRRMPRGPLHDPPRARLRRTGQQRTLMARRKPSRALPRTGPMVRRLPEGQERVARPPTARPLPRSPPSRTVALRAGARRRSGRTRRDRPTPARRTDHAHRGPAG